MVLAAEITTGRLTLIRNLLSPSDGSGKRGGRNDEADRMDGLVTFLIEKGFVLKNGSAFGMSGTERVAVSLRTSECFPGLAVIAGSLAAIERQVGP